MLKGTRKIAAFSFSLGLGILSGQLAQAQCTILEQSGDWSHGLTMVVDLDTNLRTEKAAEVIVECDKFSTDFRVLLANDYSPEFMRRMRGWVTDLMPDTPREVLVNFTAWTIEGHFGGGQDDDYTYHYRDLGKNTPPASTHSYSIWPGKYRLRLGAHINVQTSKSSLWTLYESNAKEVASLPGIPTIQIAFRYTGTVNCAIPYQYSLTRNDVDFGSVTTGFFDVGNNTKEEEVEFTIFRELTPEQEEVCYQPIAPTITLSSPGGDIDFIDKNEVGLNNGTSLLFTYKNSREGVERDVVFGVPLDLDRTGEYGSGDYTIRSVLKTRWHKTQGADLVTTGTWRATLQYNIDIP